MVGRGVGGAGQPRECPRVGSVGRVLGEGAVTPTQHLSTTHMWTPGVPGSSRLLPPRGDFPLRSACALLHPKPEWTSTTRLSRFLVLILLYPAPTECHRRVLSSSRLQPVPPPFLLGHEASSSASSRSAHCGDGSHRAGLPWPVSQQGRQCEPQAGAGTCSSPCLWETPVLTPPPLPGAGPPACPRGLRPTATTRQMSASQLPGLPSLSSFLPCSPSPPP